MDIEANSKSMTISPRFPVVWQPTHGRPTALTGGDMLSLMRRNALLILICASFASAAAFVFASTLPKSYTAESDLAVGGERVAIPQLQGVLQSDGLTDPMPQVHTEVQALGARQLLISLVDELQIDRIPEFNSALRPVTLFGRISSTIKSLLPAAPGRPSQQGAHDTIVNAVSRALNITQDNKSLVIGVTFTSQNPLLAATVVNRLVADYMGEIERRRAEAAVGANAALTQRTQDVASEIRQLEQQEQHLRATSGTVALRAGSIGQQQVEDLTIEESRQSVQRSEIAANLARATAAASTGNADELASVLDSATVSRLREQEAEASAKVADMSAQFGNSFPGLQSAQANLSAIRAQLGREASRIVASLSTQLKVAQAHEADVKMQLAEAHKNGAASQDVLAQLAQLDQDINARRTLYGSLLASAQQTLAQPHSEALPDVRVLSVAAMPGLPSSPNMKVATGFGGLAGALLGGVIALLRSEPHFFKSDADAASLTGATILASLRGRGGRWNRLAFASVLDGPYAGILRTALALMRMAGNETPPQAIALVGAQGGCQAASIAAALARVAAGAGKSVLLVEVDTGLDQLMGQPASPIIVPRRWPSDDVSWHDRLVPDGASTATFLFDYLKGTSLSQRIVALENLLVEAKEEFDVILLGVPRIGDADAFELARCCDLTVLVIDLAKASSVETQLAAFQLGNISPGRLGTIVLETT